MEEVINTEVGVQYKSFGLNLYNMDFSGKNLLITDVEKLIQMTMTTKDVSMFLLEIATYQGLELFGSVNLPYNLSVNVNYSLSKNVWGEPFGEEGRNVLYQDENDTDEKYEVGYPQTMLTGSLNYSKEKIKLLFLRGIIKTFISWKIMVKSQLMDILMKTMSGYLLKIQQLCQQV